MVTFRAVITAGIFEYHSLLIKSQVWITEKNEDKYLKQGKGPVINHIALLYRKIGKRLNHLLLKFASKPKLADLISDVMNLCPSDSINGHN